MNTKRKVLSALITFAIALAFVSAAAFFALHYNAWFVKKEPSAVPADNSSQNLGNRIVLNMEQPRADSGISDETLEEMNVYGFPTGDSPYFIYVEKGAHTLSVFEKDAYGLYTKRLYSWSTATGKTSVLTPVGLFTVGKKQEWYRWPAGTYSPYVTKYYERDNHYGGLFIHGPIYRWKSLDSVFSNSVRNIGKNVSSGCLRTETQAAYFVYEKCPEGTQIQIVEGAPLGFKPDRIVYVYNQTIKPSLDLFNAASFKPDSMAFAEESHSMAVGSQYTPEMLISPAGKGTPDLVWTTNNPAILKISGGSIWAVRPGTAIITASTTDNALSASMLINITVHDVDTSAEPPDVGGMTVEDDSRITEDYQPIDESLLFLTIKGKDFAINQSVKPLLNCLGSKYYEKQPVQSCAYQGLDRFFLYEYIKGGSCSISTVPMLADGGDAICEIEFKNYTTASLASSKGIKLGDSLADVQCAYGNHYTEVSVTDEKKPSASFLRITYWAGKPNDPGVPCLYFTLAPDTKTVIGMGIYSARNMG